MESTEHVKTIRQILGMDEDPFHSTIEPQEELPETGDNPVETTALPEAPVFRYKETYEKSTPEVVTIRKQSRFAGLFSRDMVRYPVIFVVSLMAFYVLFNFQAITAQIGGVFSPPPENEEAILGEELDDYNRWIKKYYVHVSSTTALSPNNDIDGDGLTNHDEFIVGSNPLKADTDGDGRDDGFEVLQGNNPLYEGKLSYTQKKALDENLVLDRVQARRSFEQNFTSGALAAEVAGINDDFHVDSTQEGNIRIPKLGVDAPIIWNKNFDYVQEDLKYGAVHHPNTPYPGEAGTASIHGHSSGYLWDGEYKYVFTRINLLEPGDEVFVTVQSTKGKERTYRYVVTSKKAYGKDDPEQFADYGGYHLNISTSWPIGTARERFVVTTELAGL